MTSSLSGIALAKRRQLAATLGLFAMLFIAVGAVAATGASTVLIKGFVVVALLIAVLLALMAWGVLHSVRSEAAERRLDAAIESVVQANGAQLCDCGQQHDPDELHYVSQSQNCAHDGTGDECEHSCATCVLAALRTEGGEPAASGSVAQGSVAQGSVARASVARGSVAQGSVAQGSVAQGSVARASVARASATEGSAAASSTAPGRPSPGPRRPSPSPR